MSSVVELEKVQKCYGKVQAVEDVSLAIHKGEILGLLGHNGAVKTTLMKMILGLISPSAGEVRVFGQPLDRKGVQALRQQLGYLPENVSFYEQLTGREVLDYLARLKGVGCAERDALLERVGLSHAADRRVKTYSKGMRQRLGLVQAMLGKPRLLLLDEPTVGLDPIATRDFYATLDELRSNGVTVLLCSHVLPGIERHVDRVAILGKGKLLALGSVEELRRHSRLPVAIHVRGIWKQEQWQQQLEQSGSQIRRINGTRLELMTPIENKMEVMRLLLEVPDIQDIEVAAPSLETLYAHFGGHAGSTTPCAPS